MAIEIMRRKNIFLIRWMIIIIISCLTVFMTTGDKQLIWSYLFIAFYISTNLFLFRIPERFFINGKIFYILVFFDSPMVALGIYLSGQAGTDFYLVYFLIIGLAAMSIGLKYLMINTTVFAFIYGWILYQDNLFKGDIAVTYALRLPFMIIIALFFGYIVEEIIKDKDKSLKESEEKYRQLFSKESDAVVIFDADTTLVQDMNDAALSLYGYSREEFLQLKSTDIFTDPGKGAHDIEEIIDGNVKNTQFQYHQKKDGTSFPAEVSAGAFVFRNRRMVSTVIRDITNRVQAQEELEKRHCHLEDLVKDRTAELELTNEKLEREIEQRKRSEEALRESEEKYRLLVDNANDAVFILQDEVIKFLNPKTAEIMGYSAEELTKIPFVNLIHPEDGYMVLEKHKKTLKGEEILDPYSFRIINKAGEKLWVELNAVLIDWEERVATLNFLRDTTEKKKLEAQLQQVQKMEAVGTLAGGIAHDFNNILFPIIGYAEMMLEDKPKNSFHRNCLNQVLLSANRARDLVKQILTFSRQREQERQPLKVQHIIQEVLKLTRSSLPSNIEIRQNIDNDCGMLMVDPSQIYQVAMNLITNAYHAMQETGGRLEVNLFEVALGPEDLNDPDMEPGLYVCLSVADTGIGMDKSVMDRIFDPYFTTKEKDKGTGLGLSVVHGIVKSYGGTIKVYSEPGKGSVFNIFLPKIDTATEKPEAVSIEPVPRGSERILLVDDEEKIVEMEKQMLTRLDYQVTARTSSIEALEAFRAQPDKFDVVIADLTMPNMTGDKLAGELINIRADIPIILCTGFSETITEEKAKALGIKEFVMKPMVMSQIANTIRNVLDQS